MVPRSDMALAGGVAPEPRSESASTLAAHGPCEVSVRLFTKASAKAKKGKRRETVCAHTVRLLRVVRYVPAVRTVEAIEVAHHIGGLLPCGG
jgi:hypothetical protein